MWTEEVLDRVVADTEGFLPGTVMGLLRIPNAEDRPALIELLESAR